MSIKNVTESIKTAVEKGAESIKISVKKGAERKDYARLYKDAQDECNFWKNKCRTAEGKFEQAKTQLKLNDYIKKENEKIAEMIEKSRKENEETQKEINTYRVICRQQTEMINNLEQELSNAEREKSKIRFTKDNAVVVIELALITIFGGVFGGVFGSVIGRLIMGWFNG